MSFTKNDQAVVLNRESLQYLANCIRLVHSLPDLLNDVLPSQTTTYSSYKVTELLNTLNTDLQNYVNNALGNLSHLKKEIVSVAPTDDSADEDTIYLVQDVSGGYEQYLKINGVVTSLGSTSAINNVYTKTESDAKFALLSTLNSLITVVGGLNDLTTTDKTSIVNAINELKSDKVNRTDIIDNLTSTDTDKPLSANQGKVLKDEVDLKANDDEVVKKTDIVTTIDETSTEAQIPSAVAFYNECQGKPISINDINTYGTKILRYPVGRWRTNTHKTASLFSDLPVPSAFFIDIFSLNNDKNENPWNASWAYNFYVFYPLGANGYYIRSIQSGESAGKIDYDSGWQKLCTMGSSVNDKSYTGISASNITNATITTGGALSYSIKNGICYVRMNGLVLSGKGNVTVPTGTFPIPDNTITNGHFPVTTNSNNCYLAVLSSSGGLNINCGTGRTDTIYTTISYPVAES